MKWTHLWLLLSVTVLSGCGDKKTDTIRNYGNLQVAITSYYADHSSAWPPSLEALVPKYISAIPMDEVSKSNRVVAAFDGKGGWHYNPATGELKLNLDAAK